MSAGQVWNGDWDDDGDCPNCGGDGFISYGCFDGCCADADYGCEECEGPCPTCSSHLIPSKPLPFPEPNP